MLMTYILSNLGYKRLISASQVDIPGGNHRFLMLPLEPHESASRQSLHGFLPYKESCASSEVVGEDAAVKKDVRSEEILTAAIWALMHGHAMFAMDEAFTNMEFKTHLDTLVHDSFELLVETPALSSK
jgi:hypothetical protein